MISTVNKANSIANCMRIVIPFEICKKLDIKKGMKVKWDLVEDNKLLLEIVRE
jgi:antitoxin component of MazEF toxin-antitoxin module